MNSEEMMKRFRELRDIKHRTHEEQSEYKCLLGQYPKFVIDAGYGLVIDKAGAENVAELAAKDMAERKTRRHSKRVEKKALKSVGAEIGGN